MAWLWGALHGWFKAWSKVKFFFSGNGSYSFLVEVVGPGDFPQAFKS